MGAGDVPWSDVERSQTGLPIGSRRGPTRIGWAAEPRFSGSVVPSIVVGSMRLWRVSSACSGRRPAGPPFGPS